MCLFVFVCIYVELGGFEGYFSHFGIKGILVILYTKGILVIWLARVNQ